MSVPERKAEFQVENWSLEKEKASSLELGSKGTASWMSNKVDFVAVSSSLLKKGPFNARR